MGNPGFGSGRNHTSERFHRNQDDSLFSSGMESPSNDAFHSGNGSEDHPNHLHDDPLDFFAENIQPRKAASGRRMIFLAGGAGAILGLVAVSLFITMMEGRGTAAIRPEQTARTGTDVPWQRPVISAKTDLETAVTQSAALNAALPLSLGSNQAITTAPEEKSEATSKEPLIQLASLPAETEILRDVSTPEVLQGILYYAPGRSGLGSAGNETVVRKRPPLEPVDRTILLKAGETLIDHLMRLGVSEEVARALQATIEKTVPGLKLRAGQKIAITLDRQQDFYGSEVTYPVYLALNVAPGRKLIVESDEDGQFSARIERDKTLTVRARTKEKATKESPYIHVRGTITSSLYAAARDKGVPPYIISEMLRAFGYSIDLQRQVKKGDTFEILYGAPRSGSSKRRKVLYYAALTLSGRKHAIYRFTTPKGRTAFFDEKGRSVIRNLMRTPISGARISSGFGYRRHPVLGYTKLHTGVDFAAPPGTPIRAAGDGVVIHAGWRGGYGRTVMIRHPNGYVTLYAHQSRIARGIRKGVRVRQGQVIGYVGASGRVTGPHLHYEVRINKKPVNPLRVRVATRVRLKGKALELFRQYRKQVLALLKKTPVSTRVAQNTR